MKYLKQYWVAALVLVIIIIGFAYSARHQGSQTAQSSSQNNQNQDQMAPETTPSPTPTAMMMGTQTWTGTLLSSNNLSKGNLMLVTPAHTIYINSSKDYSMMFNKQVTVSYQGSLDSFTLEGITAN